MEKKTYIVAPGAAVYSGGKTRAEGTEVSLGKADADRLLASRSILVPEGKGGTSDPPADPLAAMLTGTVAEVTEGLAGMSDDELAKLAELEGNGKARVGVLTAIEAEQAARAAG